MVEELGPCSTGAIGEAAELPFNPTLSGTSALPQCLDSLCHTRRIPEPAAILVKLFLKSLRRYLALLVQLVASPRRDGRRAGGFLLVLAASPLVIAVQLLHWLAFLLDEVFYRGYRDIAIREPLFVLGPPRTGTTHLHRVLAADPQTTTFQTWECLFGLSVSSRKLLLALARLDRAMGRPAGRVGSWLGRRLLAPMDDIHPVALTDPEEDFLCLLPLAACFLLVIPFPRAAWLWDIARFDTRLGEDEKRELLDWYRHCIQKHLYVFGADKRFLSKNASFSGMAEALLAAFPDARILYTSRDPRAVVPSQLSSLRPALEACGFAEYPGELRDGLVDLLRYYYEHLFEVAARNPDRMALLYNDDLQNDLSATVVASLGSVGLDVGDGFMDELAAMSAASREHQSDHRYSPEQFGLSDDMIVAQFARVYALYQFRGHSGPGEDIQ
ncbi:MAG TPA: sulfotransferase [Woeseiaceae bacterium]|nr:sulfotransferase [Woeseiaceae bacterium]